MTRLVQVATAAYPLEALSGWDQYSEKLERWVANAARDGAQLLVFPEYAGMELAMLAGADLASLLQPSLKAVSERIPQADEIHAALAKQYNVHICAGSAPVYDPAISDRPVNRARLITPSGRIGVQDKQILARWERDPMQAVGGGPLRLFETELGKIGILICYDGEFPLLGHGFRDADLMLVPSCTEELAGYHRVRIGAMARALEMQCVTVMASLTGSAPWNEVADKTIGAGGIYGPPDHGFPDDGVLAQGDIGQPGWTMAEVDLEAIAHVRADGHVLNRSHWSEQDSRRTDLTIVPLT